MSTEPAINLDFAELEAELADETVEAEAPKPPTRTLLETWIALFDSIQTVREQKINMAMTMNILGRHDALVVGDLTTFFRRYYEILDDARSIVNYEVATDAGCLNNREEDVVDNKNHYLNIFIGWLQMLAELEEEWHVDNFEADIEMAAIIEARAFLVGEQGVIQHLQTINFQFGEDERALVDAAMAGEES